MYKVNMPSTKMLVAFIKKSGRCTARELVNKFATSKTAMRGYLSAAIGAGLIRREKEGVQVFYAAVKKTGRLRLDRPVLDAPSASRHLNQVWGWVKPKPKKVMAAKAV